MRQQQKWVILIHSALFEFLDFNFKAPRCPRTTTTTISSRCGKPFNHNTFSARTGSAFHFCGGGVFVRGLLRESRCEAGGAHWRLWCGQVQPPFQDMVCASSSFPHRKSSVCSHSDLLRLSPSAGSHVTSSIWSPSPRSVWNLRPRALRPMGRSQETCRLRWKHLESSSQVLESYNRACDVCMPSSMFDVFLLAASGCTLIIGVGPLRGSKWTLKTTRPPLSKPLPRQHAGDQGTDLGHCWAGALQGHHQRVRVA